VPEIILRQIIDKAFFPGFPEMFCDTVFCMFKVIGYGRNSHYRVLCY
jgi:hypothetical protein